MDDFREMMVMEWIEPHKDNHYEYDFLGHEIKVDLPRDKVESILDISLLLVDRIQEAKGDLKSKEYIELEKRVREEHPSDSSWVLFTTLEAVSNDRLYGRYRDIELMIKKLNPRDLSTDSAAYRLMVRQDVQGMIYSIIRNVDDVDEEYINMVYTFFLGIMAKGWGEGLGWYKSEDGNWCWHKEE